jgi:hypothetical protein
MRATYDAGRAAAKGRRLKQEVLSHYGTHCACCGESTFEFLQIDHVNNDGAAHRKAIGRGAGTGTYNWLKKNGWPKGFQALCANCNFAKSRYGRCPHQPLPT